MIKRVTDEEHSDALRARVRELIDTAQLITSTLGWVEVSRGVRRRTDSAHVADAETVALSAVAGYPVSYEVIGVARSIGAPELRSLDAIHCATAIVAQVSLVVAYDERLLAAAGACGIRTESPGT